MWRILLCCCVLLTACSSGRSDVSDTNVPETVATVPMRQTSVFEYGDVNGEGFAFTVKVLDDGLAVWLPSLFGKPYLHLTRARSASGAKYEKDGVVVWLKGREALLEVDGKTYANCVENVSKSIWEDAKLRGVDFRAVGNEPGWHLELTRGDHIVFIYNYGQDTVSVATPEPVVDTDGKRAVYYTNNLTVTVLGEPCQDTMSGEMFESQVTVTMDGKTFRGCGRALH